jgi:hypothetical protein
MLIGGERCWRCRAYVLVDVADEADLADFMAEAAPIIASFDVPPR